jgi:carbonic anhydrase/acetyltransferase-like protein (isoleucine patch superfamily)
MKEIHHTVKIMPGTHVLGQVQIGRKSSLWHNVVVRGDIEPIHIGCYSNVQDNCVLHASRGFPLYLGNFVSAGQTAVLHGCRVEDNCIIGMNATLLNGCHVGKNSIIGAGSVLTDEKNFPPGCLIRGLPGRVVRELSPEEILEIKNNALRYAEMGLKK